jgi:hypothetical protein
LDALSEEPLTLADLLAKPEIGQLGTHATFQALVLAVAARLVAPALAPEGLAPRRKSTERLNKAVLSQLDGDRQEQTLASPILGTGVPVARVDQVFLATRAGDPKVPIEVVMAAITARHQQLRKRGKPVTSLEETRSELESALVEFRESRLPVYQRPGLEQST